MKTLHNKAFFTIVLNTGILDYVLPKTSFRLLKRFQEHIKNIKSFQRERRERIWTNQRFNTIYLARWRNPKLKT